MEEKKRMAKNRSEESGEKEIPGERLIFSSYMKEARDKPLLNREEEVALFKKLEEEKEKFLKIALKRSSMRKCLVVYLEGKKTDGKENENFGVNPKSALKALKKIKRICAAAHKSPGKIIAALKKAKINISLAILESWLTKSKDKEKLSAHKSDLISAKNTLVDSNVRLVIKIAKEFLRPWRDFKDLVQDGNIGLIYAVDKFEYRRGYKLSTYASWWIWTFIARGIMDKGRTIRIPVHTSQIIQTLNRAERALLQKYGLEPTAEELAYKLKWPKKKVKQVLSIVREPISLDNPIGEDADGSDIAYFIADTKIPGPETSLAQKQFIESIKWLVSRLTPREEMVIRMRFGIGYSRDYTLAEVGAKLRLTRERIRQIEAKALEKLRIIVKREATKRRFGFRNYL